jgi:hypothetical protein
MATITLTIDDAHLPRIRAAVAEDYNLLDAQGNRRTATNAEARQWVIDRLADVVRRAERKAKEAAALAAVTDDGVNIT